MNPNIEYEKYIKTVFTQILKNENIQNVFVDHDVKLKGKTATHQIDVYWEYKQFGELIKVAVECKRYSKNVSIGVVRDFNSVLQDLNCSKGIIVTTTGFQKGAIEFASNNNISLKITRKPVAKELKNTPKTLRIELNFIPRKVTNVAINLDKDWCLNNVSGMKDDFSDVFNKLNTEIVLVDCNGHKIADMLDLENQLPVNTAPSFNNVHKYDYKNAYLVYETKNLLKVSEVIFTYDILNVKSNKEFDIHSQITAIIKDCINNNSKYLFKKEVL
jgi:hypothetical protein